MPERLYFRQLLSGRDFAVGDPLATQMVNFVYLIGDDDTRDAVVVDPAYGVADILDVLEGDGMRLAGVLATHHHPDHVGGSMMGYSIEGISKVLERRPVPIHVHRDEAEWVRRVTGVDSTDLVAHESGDRVKVGDLDVEVLHTPGHTPGSQCFLVEERLVAGDTLFLQGCGRTDLPGSDPEAMFDSLAKLASLPDDVVVFPGHRYSLPSAATLGAVKETNMVFKPTDRQQWLAAFAGM